MIVHLRGRGGRWTGPGGALVIRREDKEEDKAGIWKKIRLENIKEKSKKEIKKK
jgi:hypothetical protein